MTSPTVGLLTVTPLRPYPFRVAPAGLFAPFPPPDVECAMDQAYMTERLGERPSSSPIGIEFLGKEPEQTGVYMH